MPNNRSAITCVGLTSSGNKIRLPVFSCSIRRGVDLIYQKYMISTWNLFWRRQRDARPHHGFPISIKNRYIGVSPWCVNQNSTDVVGFLKLVLDGSYPSVGCFEAVHRNRFPEMRRCLAYTSRCPIICYSFYFWDFVKHVKCWSISNFVIKPRTKNFSWWSNSKTVQKNQQFFA